MGSTPKPITPDFDLETLSAIAARIDERAEQIGDRHTMAELAADLRVAASCVRRLVELQDGIIGLAQVYIQNPTWDVGALARDLRQLVEPKEGGE